MDPKHRETILAFADCNMNIRETARRLYFGCTTISYRLGKIHELYGLDPRNFYDLCKLVEMAKEGADEEDSE